MSTCTCFVWMEQKAYPMNGCCVKCILVTKAWLSMCWCKFSHTEILQACCNCFFLKFPSIILSHHCKKSKAIWRMVFYYQESSKYLLGLGSIFYTIKHGRTGNLPFWNYILFGWVKNIFSESWFSHYLFIWLVRVEKSFPNGRELFFQRVGNIYLAFISILQLPLSYLPNFHFFLLSLTFHTKN